MPTFYERKIKMHQDIHANQGIKILVVYNVHHFDRLVPSEVTSSVICMVIQNTISPKSNIGPVKAMHSISRHTTHGSFPVRM